jgi:hypothetical protein
MSRLSALHASGSEADPSNSRRNRFHPARPAALNSVQVLLPLEEPERITTLGKCYRTCSSGVVGSMLTVACLLS